AGGERRFVAIAPVAPFLAVQDEARRINRAAAPLFGVLMLAFRKRFRRERVLPAEVIPIVHVKRDGNEILPELRTVLQMRQPLFGGRATAASFGRIEFEEGSLGGLALKLEWSGAHKFEIGEEQSAEHKNAA